MRARRDARRGARRTSRRSSGYSGTPIISAAFVRTRDPPRDADARAGDAGRAAALFAAGAGAAVPPRVATRPTRDGSAVTRALDAMPTPRAA